MAATARQGANESSSLDIDPSLRSELGKAVSSVGYHQGGVNSSLDNASRNYQTNFSQFSPNLNTNFAGPQFNNGLDAMSQNLVSAGHGQLAGQRAAQNSQIQQQFGNKNPALAAILQAQGNNQSQLAGNGLNFQAALAQRQREGQEYQFGQQAQAMGNQAQLSQSGFQAGLQQQGNAALQQQAQLQAARMANAQNWLSSLGQFAQLTGTQKGGSQQTSQGGDPLSKLLGGIFG